MRLLLGDPSGKHLASRDGERRIGGGVTGRVAAVLTHYAPLSDVVEIGLHDTPLYNSIYRFDDQLLVNTHVYGLLAAHTPQRPAAEVRKPSASVVVRDATGRVLMLRRTDNGLWTIPTGGLKKNETISACGIRECLSLIHI